MNIHEVEDLLGGLDGIQCPRGKRSANLFCDVASTDLVSEAFNRLGSWSDPNDSSVRHGAGKVRVLGEKTVTGVNCVRPGTFCGREDLRNDEIGVGTRCAIKADCLVRHFDVLRINILIRVNRNGRDSRVLGRANHANGNFTAIGDEDLGNSC
ncbi:unannotated protein [freshwater metagenome]|uniref:Unannotated protein n=1 Tax=freshwater metagenome TaxID=449393 RepID=A0A6J6JBH8_9ZZZZ